MRYFRTIFCLLAGVHFGVSAAVPYLNENGILIVNEQPCFPVVLYRVPVGEFTNMKTAGFTCTEVSEYAEDQQEMLRYLDAAKEHGFKILPIFNYAATRILPDLYQQMVERFRDRDEVLLWYMADEPQEYKITPEGALSIYKAIKEADPVRPVFLMLAKVDPAYLEAADIIGVDPYPVANDKPLTLVAETIRYVQEKGGGRPIWACLEAFGALSYGRPFPSPEELRCTTYMALAQGIQGIMFFAYGCPEQKGALQETAPELWQEVLRLAAEIRDLSPLFTNAPCVQSQKLQPELPGVYSRLFEREGEQWLLLVNGNRDTAIVTVSLPGFGSTQVNACSQQRIIPLSGDSFQVTLAPLEVAWYVMQTENMQ